MGIKTEDKYKKFVLEYIKDNNGSRAAIAAGYSKKTAEATASRLLTNVNVKALLDKHRAKVLNKIEISAEKVLQEYAKIAFGSMGNFVKSVAKDGTITYNDDLTDEDKSLISEISNGRVKLYDKTKALEALSRNLGLFNDKLKLEGFKIEISKEDAEYLED